MTAANLTIIKRVVDDDHDGHHGGAWKVAYADFMTAMMAFFLLLWILSSSDEQKLRGIAEYFTDATEPGGMGVLDGASLGPPGTLTASNGALLARGSELGEEDQTVIAKWEVRDTTPTIDVQDEVPGRSQGEFSNPASGDNLQAENAEVAPDSLRQRMDTTVTNPADETGESRHSSQASSSQAEGGEHTEDLARFASLEVELKQAMQENPDLRPLMENLVFELTPKGLRIQVIDQQGKPMFASGSADMLAATRTLMGKLGQSLASLPNPVVITGHTDAVPFSGRANYDNWDLSTDRANATRRVLVSAGVDKERLISVTGKAYTEPLVPTEPEDPSNRRISVLLQYSDTASSANTDSTVTRPAGQLSSGSAASQQAMQEDQANTVREDNEMPTQNIAPLLDNATLDSLRNVLR